MEQEFGHHTIADDFAIVVNIINEQIQRRDALLQPALDRLPFAGFNHARHDVERPDLFGARLMAIHREGDAQVQERPFGIALAALQFPLGKRFNPPHQCLAPRPGRAFGGEHFVVKTIGRIGGKTHDWIAIERSRVRVRIAA
jgi:hypothetical protein